MRNSALFFGLLASLLWMAGCQTPEPTATPGAGPISALYLAGEEGELDAGALAAHPEVRAVASFQALQEAVLMRPMGSDAVAIWIDRSAVDQVEKGWLRRAPQNGYPLIVVGVDDATYAFGELLEMPIKGRYGRGTTVTLRPGFSMWTLETAGAGGNRAVLHSYQATPTVGRLLDVARPYLQREA